MLKNVKFEVRNLSHIAALTEAVKSKGGNIITPKGNIALAHITELGDLVFFSEQDLVLGKDKYINSASLQRTTVGPVLSSIGIRSRGARSPKCTSA
jgi:hypothetical protein